MDEIEPLRQKMDVLTMEMARLLLARTRVATDIGTLKKETGRDITDETREFQLRQKILGLCEQEGLVDDRESGEYDVVTRFLNFLLNESVRIQQQQQQSTATGAAATHLSVFHRAQELERAGRSIIHMEVGEPDFMPPAATGRALTDAYTNGYTRYGPARGRPEFRQALAAYASGKFGAQVSADNIMVSPGGRFAVFAAVTTLLNPTDEMIVIEPAWPAYRDCAMHAGIKVRTIHTTLEDGWTPSTTEIAKLVNSHTRMIVLNYPNNPTGKVLTKGTMDTIMSLAAEHGLYVLSDEIYSEYAGKNSGWQSVLSYGYDRGIAIQSFSKSHAMTGFRIGYAVADAQIIDRMAALGALCLTSTSEPIQYAAMKALEEDVSGNADMIARRLDVLMQHAHSMNMEFMEPDGGMYIFARIRRDDDRFDGTAFSESALEGEGVAVAPGAGFGSYRDFIRISACNDAKILIKGMNSLKGMLYGGHI